MAEERSAEVLDDLRQKRLAYFQSVTGSSGSNAQDEYPPKHVPTTKESNTHKLTFGDSSRNKSGVPKHDLVHSTILTGLSKHAHQSEFTASRVHASPSPNGVSTVENSKNGSFNPTASSVSHDKELKLHTEQKLNTSGKSHDKVSTVYATSTSIHEDKGETDKKDGPTVTLPGGDSDGYNETVERLIRATKEELLGNKSSDDIWQRIRKTSESEISLKTDENENHSLRISDHPKDYKTSFNSSPKEDIVSREKQNDRFTADYKAMVRESSHYTNSDRDIIEPLVEKYNHKRDISNENHKITNENHQDFSHLPTKGTGILEPSITKQIGKFEANRQSYDSATVEAIFSSRQAPWSVTPNPHLDLQESKDLEIISEKKVEESLNLSDLGLSTHRPESDTDSVQASDLNLGDSITVELRTVLGEEKFQQFLAKSKRDIDDLHETRSDRSVKRDKTPRLLKESPSNAKHVQPSSQNTVFKKDIAGGIQISTVNEDKKSRDFVRQTSEPNIPSKITQSSRKPTRQISSADPRERQGSLSNRSSDFTPRMAAGETVSSIIGEYVLDVKDKEGSNTPNSPLVKPETTHESSREKAGVESARGVPELNLSEITKTESPRPKLNRPKHEPYNIYQDKAKSFDIKRSEREHLKHDPAVNYEQVPVAKNVVFSADEIYSQAYGSMYHSHPEFQIMSPHMASSFHGSIQSSGPSPVSGPAFSIPLTPTTPVFSGAHVTQSPMANQGHPVQMGMNGTHVTHSHMTNQSHSVQMGINTDEMAKLQHFNTNIAKHHTHPMDNMQVPHPPNQALQQPPLQQNHIPGYGHVYDYTQDYRGHPVSMGNQFANSLHKNEPVSHIPHPPVMSEHSRTSQPNVVSSFQPQPRHPTGYSAHSYPMMMASHPTHNETHKWEEQMLIPPQTPSTSNVEVQTDTVKSTDMDKVTLVEESAFTSVSQIPDSDVKVPHPPPTKKSTRPSPRKPIKGQDANRHIDGIRQHHEQRRQEQEDTKLTDEEILARQRKFAKASLDRYFTSLENLYITPKPNAVKEPTDHPDDTIKEADDEEDKSEVVGGDHEINEAFDMFKENRVSPVQMPYKETTKVEVDQSWTEGYKEGYRNAQMNHLDVGKSVDEETLVNSEVTAMTVNAGGVTERLESMGVHVSHSGNLNEDVGKNVDDSLRKKQSQKQGKRLLVCPECEGLNKEYMSWCTHCGEMIIGVEPKLVSKTRDGKLRIKPVTENKDQIVTKLNNINNNTHSIEVNYIQEIADKPFSLNLEELKSEERDVFVDRKNTSPIKSDGKDSGRPSSDDRDNDILGHAIEVVNVISEVATDPVVQVPYVLGLKPHDVQETLHNDNHRPVDNVLKYKDDAILKNCAQESNKLNSAGAQEDKKESEALTVAERVKRIESVKEGELNDRTDTSTQFKNTPQIKGDLAMDSIGASYLIMSKKHDLIKSSLGINETGDNVQSVKSVNIKKSFTEKEGLTSVFELTADRSESQSHAESQGHERFDIKDTHILPKQSAQTSKVDNSMEGTRDVRHTNKNVESLPVTKKSFTQSASDNLNMNRQSSSAGNIQFKPSIDNETDLQSRDREVPATVSDHVDKNEPMVPPPLPNFSAHVPVIHNELALNLPANSMDFSYDYSQVGSINCEALDEFKTEEEMKAIKEEKKKERRRKRGHGAIDVEVFGIEEMRESRNSSRGQKLVPILNLAGNSSDDDDDDFSTQSDTKSDMKSEMFDEPGPSNPMATTASVNAWGREVIPEDPRFDNDIYPDLEESSRSPDTSARPLSDVLSASIVQEQPRQHVVSDSNEDWKLLFNPQDAEEEVQEDHDDSISMDLNQPFLEHVLKQEPQPVKSKNRPKSATKSKPVKSKVRQSLEEANYQRKWARSSTAWSSYNNGELNTSTSLRSSAELTRPSSAPKGRNLGNTVSRNQDSRDSSPPKQPVGRTKRPSSADVNKRLSQSTSDLLKALQASTSSNYGTQNSRDASPYRPVSRTGHHHGNSRNEDSQEDMLGPDDDDIDRMNEAGYQENRDSSPQGHAAGVEHRQSLNDSAHAVAKETVPLRLNLSKDKRPSSAAKSKGKQPKQKKKGNHGNDLDLSVDLVTVEHRLPKPGIMEWLSDLISATSPKSTYDKYLEMTPRIEAGTMSKWQCLPDEILLHVFAYLDQTSLTTCAQVCHQFYRVAMDESLWKYITVKKRNDLDDLCLVEIAKRHPVSLALIQCQGEQVTSKGLRDLFRECSPTLKELNISLCSKGALQGDSLLLHAAARCNHVTHIDTSWCSVTDSGLMAISNTVDRLESLCINGCQAISDDGLETIIKKHGASLRVLEMFGCFNLSPRGLRCISNNCINLLSINVGNCYKLTDSCIAQLSTSLGRVETLDLRGCKQIKDNSIRRVVKNCPRLKSLSLANCPNITDVSLLEISTYLTDIRSIDLCGCKKVTDSSVRALVNTCTNLHEIDISSTGCTHRSVSMIANFCGQRLETLKINFLSDVTEQSLIKLAKHCQRLKSVHMYGCPSVRNMSKIRDERPSFTINM